MLAVKTSGNRGVFSGTTLILDVDPGARPAPPGASKHWDGKIVLLTSARRCEFCGARDMETVGHSRVAAKCG